MTKTIKEGRGAYFKFRPLEGALSRRGVGGGGVGANLRIYGRGFYNVTCQYSPVRIRILSTTLDDAITN